MDPTKQTCPDLSPVGHENDAGARLAHLEDLIAARAGAERHALVADYHEAAAAGAMHAADDEGVILVTLLTREGHSHVYALPRAIAAHLREQLTELRHSPSTVAAKCPCRARKGDTLAGSRDGQCKESRNPKP